MIAVEFTITNSRFCYLLTYFPFVNRSTLKQLIFYTAMDKSNLIEATMETIDCFLEQYLRYGAN